MYLQTGLTNTGMWLCWALGDKNITHTALVLILTDFLSSCISENVGKCRERSVYIVQDSKVLKTEIVFY